MENTCLSFFADAQNDNDGRSPGVLIVQYVGFNGVV